MVSSGTFLLRNASSGFSTPCFSRHPDGTTFLVAGSDEGRIHLYSNIDHNLNGTFTETGGLYDWLSSTPADTLFGWQSSPAIGYLTDAISFDMITGNFAGGLHYITKRQPAEIVPGMAEQPGGTNASLSVWPNPADYTVTVQYNELPVTKHPSPIVICNLFGQKVMELPFTGRITLPVSTLPDGMYLIRYHSATAKLIISHQQNR